MKKIRRREDKLKLVIIAMLAMMLALTMLSLVGCSTLEATGGRTKVSATGGPGVILNMLADLKAQGALQTTPGGFTIRNNDPGIGMLSNEEGGVSKDVDIYVRATSTSGRSDYILYRGPAEVQTPGWIKIWNEETETWEKFDTPSWITVDGLEAIHFESAFVQSVTLRLRLGSAKVQEIKFDTYGRKLNGNTYERVNSLFIRLPRNNYRLEIFPYTGKGIFKSGKGQPYTRSLYISTNPTNTKVGNTWIGWKLKL